MSIIDSSLCQHKFDVVISVGVKDVFIVKKNIKYIAKYINPVHIYLITNKRFWGFYGTKFCNRYHLELIDENNLVSGMRIDAVSDRVNNHFINGFRGGWYFQQFLKIGFSLSNYAKEYYLVWDADTIPTSNISFFNHEGKMLLAMKTEFNAPYFQTMQKLIGIGKSVDFSFIAEHMMIKTQYMRELVATIISSSVHGDSWWEKIINATPIENGLSFSEFETYGTFVHLHHREAVEYRTLRTMRNAGKLFGRLIKNFEIDQFYGVTDTISLEAGHLPHGIRKYLGYMQLGFLRLLKP